VIAILTVLALARSAVTHAHTDPAGPPACSSTGVSIVLQAFRADQQTEIDLSESITTCETVCFRTVLGKPPLNSVCAFQAGTLSITTPDGVVHDVTPPGGIPCLGGTNPTFCNPALMSITSEFVCYIVREQDIDETLGLLLTQTAYRNGTSHSAPNDLPGVVSGGTALALCGEVSARSRICRSARPVKRMGIRAP
jgi:hypothetical protein